MGLPISAVVANLYMEHFEQFALECAPSQPRLWKECMDGTCCMIRSGAVEEFHKHMNSIHPLIQFVVELENEGALPFLDTLLQWKSDGCLDICVYKRPTHGYLATMEE